MSQHKQKTATYELMKRLVTTYLRHYVGQLIIATLFMAVAAGMTAGIALLIQPILDDVLGGSKKEMILPVGFAILGVFVTRGISTYLHTIIMNKISQSVVADVQRDLFKHFMTLDLAFFHANPSGQLISRVINDVNVMRGAVTDTFTSLGKNLLTLIFLVAVMFSKDWQLALAAFTIFPFLAIFIYYLGRRLRKISGNIQISMANLSDRLSQTFQGIRQVKAYGMEEAETKRSAGMIDNVRRLNIKSVRIGNMSTPVNEILAGFICFGIIVYGGHKVAAGDMTSGQLISFLSAFLMAYEPMKKLAKLNNSLQIGLAAAERVFDMLDLKPTIKDRADAKTFQSTKPDITFKDVSFSYEGAEARALNSISFTAKNGEVTALVGPSGGGKTTVLNMIPRFYDVTSGEVSIDGMDISQLTTSSLRENIALVSQDITIFDDTIEVNIGYGRAGATKAEIREAAKAAAADDFISEFPEGYNTQVGEDGVKLSGGQRQRIAIARAILRDAPILLLDEATSALDNESEKAVQEALSTLEKGRTTIVIAHRLSTVQGAAQIIVMDEGAIAEQGTHGELLAKKALYAKMYKSGLKE